MSEVRTKVETKVRSAGSRQMERLSLLSIQVARRGYSARSSERPVDPSMVIINCAPSNEISSDLMAKRGW